MTKRAVCLIVSTFVSVFASASSLVALPWITLERTGNTAATGLVAASEVAPVALSAFFTGSLIGHLGSRTARIGSDLLGAVMACILGVVLSLDQFNLMLLILAAFLYGAVRSPAPAASLVMLEALPGEGIKFRRSLRATHMAAVRTGYVLGAPCAGVALSTFEPLYVLLATSAGYTCSAVLILAAQLDNVKNDATVKGKDLMLMTGLRVIREDRLLKHTGLLLCGTAIMQGAWSTVLAPAYGYRILDSPGRLGLLLGTLSAGAVIGNFVYPILRQKVAAPTVLWCSLLLHTTLIYGAAAVLDNFTLLLISFLIGGLATGIVGLHWVSLLADQSSGVELGAAYGFGYAVEQACAVLGAGVIGLLLQSVSVEVILAVFAFGGAVLSVSALRHTSILGSG